MARFGVFPSIASEELPYFDDFEKETQVWQAQLDNELWEWGSSLGTIQDSRNNGSKAWVTDQAERYPANTHTWLYSPCVDLTTVKRPALSLNYWTDSEIGLRWNRPSSFNRSRTKLADYRFRHNRPQLV